MYELFLLKPFTVKTTLYPWPDHILILQAYQLRMTTKQPNFRLFIMLIAYLKIIKSNAGIVPAGFRQTALEAERMI